MSTSTTRRQGETKKQQAIREQQARGHARDARQWFADLAPRLYRRDRKTGALVRTDFRNVVDKGRHV